MVDLVLPRRHIFSAKDDALLTLPFFFGDNEGHAIPLGADALNPIPVPVPDRIVPESIKSGLLSGGVTTGRESSDEISEETL